MERAELLTVEHRFWINKPGVSMLVLSPSFHMPQDWKTNGWSERREPVVVVRPDGSEIGATAQINMTHLSIRGPLKNPRDCWRITVWLTDRTEEDVPVGSKILASPNIRDALLQKNAV
jgi:hypothetical protein